MTFPRYVLAARNRKSAGKRIKIDLRAGIGNLLDVNVPLDPHVELPVGIAPLRRTDHRDILKRYMVKCIWREFFDFFTYLVIHAFFS